MIEDQDVRDARRWIERRVHGGATREDLHRLVDGTLDGLLTGALRREQAERLRADVAENEATRATNQLAALRQGLAALGEKN